MLDLSCILFNIKGPLRPALEIVILLNPGYRRYRRKSMSYHFYFTFRPATDQFFRCPNDFQITFQPLFRTLEISIPAPGFLQSLFQINLKPKMNDLSIPNGCLTP